MIRRERQVQESMTKLVFVLNYVMSCTGGGIASFIGLKGLRKIQICHRVVVSTTKDIKDNSSYTSGSLGT